MTAAPESGLSRPGNNFDLLRLVFASLVMLYHLVVLAGGSVGFILFHLPTQAVDGFFVISGFLVAQSADQTTGVARFYVKRLFRLYPLYCVTVLGQAAAMTALLGFSYPGVWHETALYLGANLAFANFIKPAMGDVLAGLPVQVVNPSLWTLKIEVAFYIIVPGIVALVRGSGRWVLLALLIASIAYRAMMGAHDAVLARQLPGALQFFVVGTAAYFLALERYCRGPAAIAACLVSAVLCGVFWEGLPDALTAPLLGVFVLTFAFALPVIRLRRDISYGVYLLHAPLIQLLLLATRGFDVPLWLLGAVGCSATLMLALGAARAIEEPAIAFGRQLIASQHLPLQAKG